MEGFSVKLPVELHVTLMMLSSQQRAENDLLRHSAVLSIEEYVSQHQYLFTGRVLDFGCGKPGTCRKPHPYRHLISGEYIGVDVGDYIHGPFDAILCTEVMVYLPNPLDQLKYLRKMLNPGGSILLTYTSAWPECEPCSLWRFTAAGMRFLLESAGFEQVVDTPLCQLRIGLNTLVIGHGVTAVKL